jgi:8-amino-7-oxononanoate synthase
MDLIRKSLEFIRSRGLYPDIKVLESAPDREVTIAGRKVLLFCSSNYLGLASNEELKRAVIAAVNKYGVGSSGSRLISGTFDAHTKAEETIAKFKHAEAAIMYNTGYMANVGAITAITKVFSLNPLDQLRSTLVISDELNHASIIDGCRLSKARVEVYRHKDLNHLEKLLSKFKRHRKIILTDGVFSMDGDIAPLFIFSSKPTALASTWSAFLRRSFGRRISSTTCLDFWGFSKEKSVQ